MFSTRNHSKHTSSHRSRDSHTENLRITIENLIVAFNEPKYRKGVDPISLSNTLADLFEYSAGNKNMSIRCPAPMDDIEDIHTIMWPEGARVSSRAPSETSRASSRRGSNAISTDFVRDVRTPYMIRRASTVISSVASSRRYVGFAEEEEPEYVARPPSRRVPANTRTVRVNDAVMRPTPSIEKMFAHRTVDDVQEYEEEPSVEFKQAEPQYYSNTRSERPAARRRDRSVRINDNVNIEPLNTPRNTATRRAPQSTNNFAD